MREIKEKYDLTQHSHLWNPLPQEVMETHTSGTDILKDWIIL